MPVLDIGCGSNKLGDVGVDIAAWPGVDAVVQLGFEPLPFADNTFEKVYSVHSIEHVPFLVWTMTPDRKWARYYPMLQLLDEVYRVLQPGHDFEIITLCAVGSHGVDPRAWEDPTHCSIWTLGTINHFCGSRDSAVGNLNDTMAGLHVPFIPILNELNSDKLLHIVLRKP